MVSIFDITLVLLLVNFSEGSNADCWWTGCQLHTWAVQGCFPESMYQIEQKQDCPSGVKHRCCPIGDTNENEVDTSGFHTKTPLATTTAASIPTDVHPVTPVNTFDLTWEEFSKAVISNGYPQPNSDQYKAMVSQARSAGGIQSKQELAMFLAQILWESGGLIYKRELACIQTGCPGAYDSSAGVPGKNYYGRGYIQLSHSYNYKQASIDLFGDLRLIESPDLVSEDESVAWATAFWFWRTRVRSTPGVAEFHFGATTRAINGGFECSGSYQDKARKRFEIYKNVLAAFRLQVEPIESGCYN